MKKQFDIKTGKPTIESRLSSLEERLNDHELLQHGVTHGKPNQEGGTSGAPLHGHTEPKQECTCGGGNTGALHWKTCPLSQPKEDTKKLREKIYRLIQRETIGQPWTTVGLTDKILALLK